MCCLLDPHLAVSCVFFVFLFNDNDYDDVVLGSFSADLSSVRLWNAFEGYLMAIGTKQRNDSMYRMITHH